jgi:hypothetical protein
MLPRDTDHPLLPGSGESAADLMERALPLAGTAGASYAEGRRIPEPVATAADVRYLPDLLGRPAVLAPLIGPDGALRAVHGRWLHHLPKMINIGTKGGVFVPPGSLDGDPLILVEGLFDSLSLLACGVPAVAVIGKYVEWLPGFAAGRTVLLAFDGNKPGDAAAREYARSLEPGCSQRLRPPGATKDWSNALRKGGGGTLIGWLRRHPVLGATVPAARGPIERSQEMRSC